MTPQEYTDVARFPLTTWPGMAPRAQTMNDTCSLGSLSDEENRWHRLTRPKQAQRAELEEKAKHWDDVQAQLTE